MADEKIVERFKSVDFLRFIFAVMIVMFHCNGILYSKFSNTVSNLFSGVGHMNICVDFFFIMSGFFMFRYLKKEVSVFDFAKKKFFRLAPLVWLYLLCDGRLNILKMFLLNDIGFAPRTQTVIHWFVSVLFWVSVFYFCLAKLVDKKYFNFIVWIITICSLGFCLNWSNFKLSGNYQNVFYFINIGVLRGLAGMGIGYFISELYNSGFMQNLTRGMRGFVSALEIGVFSYFLWGFTFSLKMPYRTAFTYLILFSVIFFLFLRNIGFISKLFNNKLSVILGSWSYAIYVMHPFVIKMFRIYVLTPYKDFVTDNTLLVFGLNVLAAVLVGILAHYLCEKPVNKLIKKYIFAK